MIMTSNLAILSTTEIVMILVVILVIFGSASIPKFARSLGKAKSEFEKGLQEGAAETDKKEKEEKEAKDKKEE